MTVISIALVLTRYRFIKVAVAFMTFLATALWGQCYLLNWDYGLLDGGPIPWRPLELRSVLDTSLWVALFIGITIVGLKKNYSYRPLLGLLLFLQMGNFVFTHATVLQQKERVVQAPTDHNAPAFKDAFHFSNHKNILVLILDAYQGNIFLELLKEEPALGEHFTGFTHYTNAIGTSPLTRTILPTFFTGEIFDNSVPIDEYYFSVPSSDHFLLKLLIDGGYNTNVYSYMAQWLYGHINKYLQMENQSPNQPNNYFQNKQYLSDIDTLFRVTVFRSVPHLAKNFVHRFFLLQPKLDQDRDIFVRDLNRDAQVLLETPVFKYYHLLGLHHPQVIDGVIVGGPDGSRNIAHLVNEMLVSLLTNLKYLNIYDNTAILLLGDHGTAADDTFFCRETIESIITEYCAQLERRGTQPLKDGDRFHGWNWTRALPLIMLKPFNSQEPFQVSLAPVSLKDIYPTILDISGITVDHATEGKSILDINPDKPRERRFLYYEYSLMRERYHGFFPPMFEYRVSGLPWYADSWDKTGSVYEFDGNEALLDIPTVADVKNPAFNDWNEDGIPVGWNVLRNSANTTLFPCDDAYEGIKSLHLVADRQPAPGVIQNIAVPPDWKGKAIEFAIVARVPGEPTDLAANLYYNVGGERKAVPLSSPTETSWTTVSRRFFLPNDADEDDLQILIGLRPDAKGDVFVGQVSVRLGIATP